MKKFILFACLTLVVGIAMAMGRSTVNSEDYWCQCYQGASNSTQEVCIDIEDVPSLPLAGDACNNEAAHLNAVIPLPHPTISCTPSSSPVASSSPCDLTYTNNTWFSNK